MRSSTIGNIRRGNSFEQKKRKAFTFSAAPTLPGRSHIVQPSQEIKVVWFFSSEKNCFFPSPDCPDAPLLSY
jgi:hypothetical protein